MQRPDLTAGFSLIQQQVMLFVSFLLLLMIFFGRLHPELITGELSAGPDPPSLSYKRHFELNALEALS